MPTTVVPLSRAESVRVEQLPEMCERCHAPIAPGILAGRYTGSEEAPRVDIVFICPREACRALFVGHYSPSDAGKQRWHLDPEAGVPPPKAELAPEVIELSPQFAAIYQESLVAEWFGLNSVAGVGLRRALEFLVKDFGIHVAESLEDKEEVLRLPLSKVIARHIADPHTRAVASRAAWLGNDETHYSRVWKDKDRSDLKRLIELTVVWIVSYLAGEKYLREMPE